jgi:hypothetical protein
MTGFLAAKKAGVFFHAHLVLFSSFFDDFLPERQQFFLCPSIVCDFNVFNE